MIASLLFGLGIALAVAGVALIYWPAALVVGGSVLAVGAWTWETRNPGARA